MPAPQEVEKVQVTILVDNMIGTTPYDSQCRIKSPREWVTNYDGSRYLWAGHGLSILVEATLNGVIKTVLYDTGPSDSIIAHNFVKLGLNPKEIDEIVTSHGHWDHFGGLRWVIQNVQSHTPVHVHPNMFYRRSIVSKDDGVTVRKILPEIMTEEKINALGGKVISGRIPILISSDFFLISGEVPRVTTYETGFLGHEAQVGRLWVDDQLIIDDRYLIARVRGRGLVIVTGCSHAGIVNILRHAIELTGETRIAAVIGGLHLASAEPEKIKKTVHDISEIRPDLLFIGHCTGWRAMKMLSDTLPKRLFPSSVGYRLEIRSDYDS